MDAELHLLPCCHGRISTPDRGGVIVQGLNRVCLIGLQVRPNLKDLWRDRACLTPNIFLTQVLLTFTAIWPQHRISKYLTPMAVEALYTHQTTYIIKRLCKVPEEEFQPKQHTPVVE